MSLNQSNATVQQALTELSEKYNIPFSYANDLVPLQQKVSINDENKPLGQVLDELLKNSSISHTLIGSQINLQPVRKENKERVTLNGHIKDAATDESLHGPAIASGTLGTAANTYGFVCEDAGETVV